jgi:hypothetical protein
MTDKHAWRDTLYVWDGIMKIEETSKGVNLKWNGKWLGCDDCADAKIADIPKRGFDKDIPSDMEFEVEGIAEPLSQDDADNDDRDDETAFKPHKVTLLGGEGWDMKDENEAVIKHKDSQHDLYLPSLKWTGNLKKQESTLAFAIGKNDFASFLSVGWIRPGCRLTLGRRYLDDKDARCEWSVEELKNAVLKEIIHSEGKKEKVTIPPWQCAALHSDVLPVKKKQKKGE